MNKGIVEQKVPSRIKVIIGIVLLVLAIIYDVSPVDFMPLNPLDDIAISIPALIAAIKLLKR